MKNHLVKILTAVAICGALLLLAGIYYLSQNNGYSQAINTVLTADKRIGEEIAENSSADALKAGVKKMRNIDLSQCPEEFKTAYKRHAEAFEKAVPVLEEDEKLSGWGNILESFATGFVCGFTGHWELIVAKAAIDINASLELQKAMKNATAEINSSFQEVLRIAQKYKVDTTQFNQE